MLPHMLAGLGQVPQIHYLPPVAAQAHTWVKPQLPAVVLQVPPVAALTTGTFTALSNPAGTVWYWWLDVAEADRMTMAHIHQASLAGNTYLQHLQFHKHGLLAHRQFNSLVTNPS